MSHRQGKKFSAHQILRQKDPWEVARNAFEIAVEFALLGFIEEATGLFTLFESFSSGCKSSWSPGLVFAWDATGLWPESIPPAERTADAVQKLEVERIVWKRDSNATVEGLDKLMANATNDGKRDEFGMEQLRLDDLTAAIDVAVILEERARATEILQIVADSFHLTWQSVTRSRHAWRYLKDRLLLSAIGVDLEKLMTLKNEVFLTFTKRLETGPQRPLKHLPMNDLVKMCNDNTLKNAVWEEMDLDSKDPPKTILQPAATADQIATLEDKLGYELPDDVREYLSITNGTGSLWNGFCGEPRLLGTQEIRVVDATEQQKVWESASVDVGHFMNMSVKIDWEPFDHGILANDASDDSKFVWLLEPGYAQRAAATYFETVSKLPPHEQAHIQRMMEYFYAGVDNAAQIHWLTIVWDPHTYELTTYHSWREYLEVLAGDTANADILEEKDEKGRLIHSHDIIAYSLR